MRKSLSILFVALLLGGGVSFAVNEPGNDGFKLENLTYGSQDTPVRIYQLVRHGLRGDSTSTIDSGDLVVWDTNSDDGVTVAESSSAGQGSVAGVAVTEIPTSNSGASSAASDVGLRNWGYIQVYGPASATKQSAFDGGSAGDAAYTSADSGSVGNEANATAAAGRRLGFLLDAPADSETTVEVFVTTL